MCKYSSLAWQLPSCSPRLRFVPCRGKASVRRRLRRSTGYRHLQLKTASLSLQASSRDRTATSQPRSESSCKSFEFSFFNPSCSGRRNHQAARRKHRVATFIMGDSDASQSSRAGHTPHAPFAANVEGTTAKNIADAGGAAKPGIDARRLGVGKARYGALKKIPPRATIGVSAAMKGRCYGAEGIPNWRSSPADRRRRYCRRDPSRRHSGRMADKVRAMIDLKPAKSSGLKFLKVAGPARGDRIAAALLRGRAVHERDELTPDGRTYE